MQNRTRRQNFFLILALGFLNALTPFTIDMYLPAFPPMAHDLGVQVSQIALSVSVFFIGFSLGQIIYGPLLDRFGRKPPLFLGLLIYMAANIGCAMSTSLEALLAYRFLAAIGGCATGVGATAMVRDYFPAEASSKVFSMLMLVLSASPLLAPTVGGLLINHISWRAIFMVLAGLGFANIFVVMALPKGHVPEEGYVLHPTQIYRRFKTVFMQRQFLVSILAGSFSFAGLFVYIAASPAIFMDYFHVSVQMYGVIFAILAVGMIGGGQLNHWLVAKWGSERTFRGAVLLQTVFGAVFFIGGIFNALDVVSTIALLFIILVGAGVSYPNAVSLALAPFNQDLGSASSLLGFIQLGVGSLVSACVGLVAIPGYLPTAATIFVSSLIALGILKFAKLQQTVS